MGYLNLFLLSQADKLAENSVLGVGNNGSTLPAEEREDAGDGRETSGLGPAVEVGSVVHQLVTRSKNGATCSPSRTAGRRLLSSRAR